MLMIILDDNLIFYIFPGYYKILVTNAKKVKKLIVVPTMPFKPKRQALIYNPKLALIGAYVCYSFLFLRPVKDVYCHSEPFKNDQLVTRYGLCKKG